MRSDTSVARALGPCGKGTKRSDTSPFTEEIDRQRFSFGLSMITRSVCFDDADSSVCLIADRERDVGS
jgi:hypothetical protein